MTATSTMADSFTYCLHFSRTIPTSILLACIVNCKSGLSCAQYLALALSKFDTLQEFALSYCRDLGDSHVAQVIHALEAHSKLKELDLPGNHIGGNSCVELSSLLINPNHQLTELNLHESKRMDDDAAAILASALKRNSKLTHLNLGSNTAITVRGWKSLLFTLLFMQKNPTSNIQEFNVSYNSFGNDTMSYLPRGISPQEHFVEKPEPCLQ